MRVKLSQSQWKEIGRTAGWFSKKPAATQSAQAQPQQAAAPQQQAAAPQPAQPVQQPPQQSQQPAQQPQKQEKATCTCVVFTVFDAQGAKVYEELAGGWMEDEAGASGLYIDEMEDDYEQMFPESLKKAQLNGGDYELKTYTALVPLSMIDADENVIGGSTDYGHEKGAEVWKAIVASDAEGQ